MFNGYTLYRVNVNINISFRTENGDYFGCGDEPQTYFDKSSSNRYKLLIKVKTKQMTKILTRPGVDKDKPNVWYWVTI